MTVTAPVLEDVQAHLLRPADPGLVEAAFLFVRVPDADTARRVVAGLGDDGLTVADADARKHRGTDQAVTGHVAVGFSHRGLRRIDVRYEPARTQRFLGEDDPFQLGMRARAPRLRDPATHDWPGHDSDMLLWVASTPGSGLVDRVREIVATAGAELRHTETGRYPGDPGEAHTVFGYRDGTSQPYLSELATSRRGLAGGGTPTATGWKPVPIGEFVLGAPDAGGETLVPRPEALARSGTFLVYRKYVLHPAAFEAFLERAGKEYDAACGTTGGAEVVAAKVMGRFRTEATPDGWPEGHDAVISTPSSGLGQPDGPNDFRYRHDTYGHACPLGAHVRRANPRDALGFEGQLTERHRIVRRSVPWEAGGEEGLHFVAVNARIAEQFEFVQRLWLNDGHAFRLGLDVDVVAGAPSKDRPARLVIQGERPVAVTADEPFATLLGGEYFLMPGLTGLHNLAGGGRR